MATALADHRDSVLDRLRAAQRRFIFLDFDGTLVPIADDPWSCKASDAMKATLTRLNEAPGTAVGIVSGRDLADLIPRIGVPGLGYSGNHGLEIEWNGRSFRHPEAEARREPLDRIVDELRQAVAPFPGAWVQHKGLTASVHHRQVEAGSVPSLIRVVESVVRTDSFVLRHGKAVAEVRPAVEWNKGHAVAYMTDPHAAENVSVYFGDDETDEDVFVRLAGQITIRIGDARHTAAAYFVHDPAEVHAFLNALTGLYPDAADGVTSAG
ncbi:MAG: trehalose-phosphatase [Gemmataceae bacterium]